MNRQFVASGLLENEVADKKYDAVLAKIQTEIAIALADAVDFNDFLQSRNNFDEEELKDLYEQIEESILIALPNYLVYSVSPRKGKCVFDVSLDSYYQKVEEQTNRLHQFLKSNEREEDAKKWIRSFYDTGVGTVWLKNKRANNLDQLLQALIRYQKQKDNSLLYATVVCSFTVLNSLESMAKDIGLE